MATCCCQLCPRITSYSGWPVSGHGERNALSFPLTFRSPYFLFHSAWRKIEGVRGGCEEREAGGPGRGVWGAEGAGLDRAAAPQTLQQQHECQGRPPQPVHNYCFKNKNPHSSQMPSIHSSGLFIQKSGKSFSIGCLCKELQRQISSKYTFCSPQIKSAALGHIINGQMYACLSFFP